MMFLFTGAASSGKSALSEQICVALGLRRVYLATMRPYGEEGAARVTKHRRQRAGKGFDTVECYDGFDFVAENPCFRGATVLLECLGNVVANELFGFEDASASFDEESRNIASVRARVMHGILALNNVASHLVIVGNEVGCDGESYAQETRAYQRVLGDVAALTACLSDVAVECMAGRPLVLKGTAALDALPGGVRGFLA